MLYVIHAMLLAVSLAGPPCSDSPIELSIVPYKINGLILIKIKRVLCTNHHKPVPYLFRGRSVNYCLKELIVQSTYIDHSIIDELVHYVTY